MYTADVGRIENMRPIRVVTVSFQFGLQGPEDLNSIIVPRGFCSDGASVPWWAQFPISNWGKYAQAAIVHDLLYATNFVTRKAADIIFRDAIRALGSDFSVDNGPTTRGRLSAFIGYRAVRFGGRYGYQNGSFNYYEMTGPVLARAQLRDPQLAADVIRDPKILRDAQTLSSTKIEELNLRYPDP